MQKKIYITPYKDFQITAIFENDVMTDIYADRPDDDGILDRIYVGKVKHIVKNIQAAFIDIGGIEGYYSLKENPVHLYTNQKLPDAAMTPGDELLVQVCRENVKTKAPVLTSALSLAGKYMVLKGMRSTVSLSSKITSASDRKRLQEIFEPWCSDQTGFIVRTKAVQADPETLEAEMHILKTRYEDILGKSRFLKCFSEVYKAPAEYISRLLQMEEDTDQVCTDIPDVFEKLTAHFKCPSCIRFYEDTDMPLVRLLGLETKIERLLKSRVWLKSGGSLIITATEAMVVIDVNTGKFTGKKKLEDTYFTINMDAAKEIAAQLRLRNLSGIIMVDFIDMQSAEHKNRLLAYLKSEVARDPVKTVVVDMTKLNIVEMTRKKEKKPLHEQLGITCPVCKGRGYIF